MAMLESSITVYSACKLAYLSTAKAAQKPTHSLWVQIKAEIGASAFTRADSHKAVKWTVCAPSQNKGKLEIYIIFKYAYIHIHTHTLVMTLLNTFYAAWPNLCELRDK